MQIHTLYCMTAMCPVGQVSAIKVNFYEVSVSWKIALGVFSKMGYYFIGLQRGNTTQRKMGHRTVHWCHEIQARGTVLNLEDHVQVHPWSAQSIPILLKGDGTCA